MFHISISSFRRTANEGQSKTDVLISPRSECKRSSETWIVTPSFIASRIELSLINPKFVSSKSNVNEFSMRHDEIECSLSLSWFAFCSFRLMIILSSCHSSSSFSSTVKPRYTGPKNNGNPPITNARPWSLQIISFNFLY